MLKIMRNNIFRRNPGTNGKKFLVGDSVSRLNETNKQAKLQILALCNTS